MFLCYFRNLYRHYLLTNLLGATLLGVTPLEAWAPMSQGVRQYHPILRYNRPLHRWYNKGE